VCGLGSSEGQDGLRRLDIGAVGEAGVPVAASLRREVHEMPNGSEQVDAALLDVRGHSRMRGVEVPHSPKMDPSYELPHLVLGMCYAQKGNYDLTIPELRRAVELSHGTPLMKSALANAYVRSGAKAEAEKTSC
jgi:Tfp pilus assembly protein PilF